jgi:hypothetical protein
MPCAGSFIFRPRLAEPILREWWDFDLPSKNFKHFHEQDALWHMIESEPLTSVTSVVGSTIPLSSQVQGVTTLTTTPDSSSATPEASLEYKVIVTHTTNTAAYSSEATTTSGSTSEPHTTPPPDSSSPSTIVTETTNTIAYSNTQSSSDSTATTVTTVTPISSTITNRKHKLRNRRLSSEDMGSSPGRRFNFKMNSSTYTIVTERQFPSAWKRYEELWLCHVASYNYLVRMPILYHFLQVRFKIVV